MIRIDDKKQFWRMSFSFYVCGMFLSSLIPMNYNQKHPSFWSQIDPSLQNFLHIPMFFGFACLFNIVLLNGGLQKKGKIGIILGVSFLLSLLLEGIQIFVPGRYPGWGDISLNMLGTVLAVLLLMLRSKGRGKKFSRPNRDKVRQARGVDRQGNCHPMIEGKTIICFASGYDAPPTSKHHIMHILAEKNTVLWVNYHASRTPTASASDMRYMAHKIKQVLNGLKRARKNLFVLTPLVIPLPSSPFARQLNRFLLIHQIRLALKRLASGPVQVWSFTPDIAYALGHFMEEKVVYYCVDDHAAFSGYDKTQVLRDEETLCRQSDLVITTSMALQEAKAPWNPNTLLVPHGVDFEHFSRAVHEAFPCPADLAAIAKPRLGFFGLIRDWVDLELLAAVALKRPNWHFVLIGDADSSVDTRRYKAISNLHFLGRKPYGDLPAYCRHLDIGLIPFKINELTIAVNPIKLREYLAAGLPVIATPMPEVKLYEKWVEIIQGTDSFESAVDRCLAAKESERLSRNSAMAAETWTQKMLQIERKLCIQAEAARP